ncbi:MAG: Crp/Fnr family transcriptional regulator [Acidobacteriia bacterium]|nr:Crp/Fnr family transcriptional regulator [Terriglobia bacterium]
MPDKPYRPRVKPDGQAAPSIDAQPVENEILLSLPAKEREAIFPQLTFVELRTHDVLLEPGEPIQFGYFMNSGMTSILTVLAEGKSVEVGLTGKDGFVGLPLIVGFSSGPTQAVVQIAGSAFRVGARGIAQAVRQCPVLANRLQRYVQMLAMQGTQVAACNRLHEVDERLARWLLMCQDRIGSNLVPLTQEFLAHMLGTRRASVTVAAGILQKAGLITYSRGNVNIVDRSRLESACCECYQIMRQQDSKWRNEKPGD